MTQEIRTFKDIQDAIIRRAKVEDTENNRNDIKEFINTAYRRIGSKKPYRWSGKDFSIRLKAQYKTGTVTATDESSTLTGDSTVWAELSHLGWKAKVAAQSFPYKILRVGSATEIVLDGVYTSDTDTGLSYALFQDEIGLPPDLQDIRKLRIPGYPRRRQPMPTSPEEIDKMRDRSPFATGLPRYYTIWGNNFYHQSTWEYFRIDHDFWEDDITSAKPKNKNLIIYPGVRTEDKMVTMRYTRILYPMVLDDEEPLVPIVNREILVYDPLEEHFLMNRDLSIQRAWKKKADDLRQEMEGDIETIDDEFLMHYDMRNTKRASRYGIVNEGSYNT